MREVERLPDVPDRRPRATPTPCCRSSASVAAFDHFRQRVTLIDNVLLPDGADEATLDAAYDDAVAPPRRAWPSTAPARSTSRWSSRPTPTSRCPRCARSMGAEPYRQAVEVAKEHILAGDIFQVVLVAALRRSTLDADPFDVYRVLRQVNPSPYMYFVRHPEVTLVGSSPEPMVQLLDGRVISRPIAGTRRRGAHRRGRPPPRRRAARAPQGAGRARDARRPRPQRRRPGRARSAPSRSTR